MLDAYKYRAVRNDEPLDLAPAPKRTFIALIEVVALLGSATPIEPGLHREISKE